MDETKYAVDLSLGFPVSSAGQGDQQCSVSCIATTTKGKKKAKQDVSRRKKKTKNTLLSQEKEPFYVKITIQDIPNNLLKHVFSYLDVRQRLRIESVCRKWRLIGKLLPWNNPTALSFMHERRNSSLAVASNELTDHILFSLLSRCGVCLKQLEFSFEPIDYVILTYRSMLKISQCCPNLERLKLRGLPVDWRCLAAVARGCPKLKEFCLCDAKNSDFSDGVMAIVRDCESLEHLEVSDVFLKDEWFEVVNPKLRKLDLVICTLSPPTPLQNLIANCDAMEDLHLSFDCDLSVDDVKKLFRIFIHFQATLEKLSIYDGGLPKYVDWRDGVRHLHGLVELSVLYSKSVDDKLLALIIVECPKLEQLVIPGSSATDRGIASLEALPLMKLDVGCNGSITDRGLSFITKKGDLVKCSMSLMPSVTEDFCCSLARSCPKLRELDVSANGGKITNRFVNAFRLSVQRQYLQPPVKLVVGCTAVTPRVKRCAGLEVKFTSDYEEGYMKFKQKKTYTVKV